MRGGGVRLGSRPGTAEAPVALHQLAHDARREFTPLDTDADVGHTHYVGR